MTSADSPLSVVNPARRSDLGGIRLPLLDDALRRILPHRPPFILLDRVDELDPQHAVGVLAVTRNDPALAGHFPGRPILPGVLLVEALAQLSGVLLWAAAGGASGGPPAGGLGVLAGVKRMRFRELVLPGDLVRLEVEMLTRSGTVAELRGTASTTRGIAADGIVQVGFRTDPRESS